MSNHENIIGEKEVEHIAHLARLEISEDEKSTFSREMGEILYFVNKLGELDTDKIEATFSVIQQQNALREDEVSSSLPLSLVLNNAPMTEDDFFKMPKILGED